MYARFLNFEPKISIFKSVFAAVIYTVFMSIIRDIAGIAKGMSITFREMFAPTVVEDYPNKKLPNEGAVFQERFRGLHVLQRERAGEMRSVLSVRGGLSLELHSHRSR